MSVVLVGDAVAVPDRWRRILVAMLLLLPGLLLIYSQTSLAIVSKWANSATFTHAFAVVPIALWLIWRKRHVLAAYEPQPTPWLLLPIFGLALVWLVGELGQVNAITQFALVALLVVSVPAIIGVRAAREIQFPLAFLFFAVPIGDFLLPVMMSWTADFTVAALRLTGIPVYRSGQQLVIPTGTWSVVEACAGLRYLIASLMMGSLFAYLTYTSMRRRLAFMAAAIVVPIVANWLRAYLIVLLGHYTDNRLAAGADHLVYGWIFFGVFVLVMFAVGGRWAEPQEVTSAPRDAAEAGPDRTWHLWSVVVATAVLAALPHFAVSALARVGAAGAPELRILDAPATGWRAVDARVADWRPSFEGVAAEGERSYRGADGVLVGVYVAYYRHQDHRRKLVSETNALVRSDDKRWLQLDSSVRTVDVDGAPIAFKTARLRSLAEGRAADGRIAAWHLYWVGGRLTASDAWAKAYSALYRLLGRGDDSAHIVVYTLESQPGAGDTAIEAFVRANLRLLEASLRATRDVD